RGVCRGINRVLDEQVIGGFFILSHRFGVIALGITTFLLAGCRGASGVLALRRSVRFAAAQHGSDGGEQGPDWGSAQKHLSSLKAIFPYRLAGSADREQFNALVTVS